MGLSRSVLFVLFLFAKLNVRLRKRHGLSFFVNQGRNKFILEESQILGYI